MSDFGKVEVKVQIYTPCTNPRMLSRRSCLSIAFFLPLWARDEQASKSKKKYNKVQNVRLTADVAAIVFDLSIKLTDVINHLGVDPSSVKRLRRGAWSMLVCSYI